MRRTLFSVTRASFAQWTCWGSCAGLHRQEHRAGNTRARSQSRTHDVVCEVSLQWRGRKVTIEQSLCRATDRHQQTRRLHDATAPQHLLRGQGQRDAGDQLPQIACHHVQRLGLVSKLDQGPALRA